MLQSIEYNNQLANFLRRILSSEYVYKLIPYNFSQGSSYTLQKCYFQCKNV